MLARIPPLRSRMVYQARENQILRQLRDATQDFEVPLIGLTGPEWIAYLGMISQPTRISDSARATLLSNDFGSGNQPHLVSIVSGQELCFYGQRRVSILEWNAPAIGLRNNLPPTAACLLLDALVRLSFWQNLPPNLLVMHQPINIDGQGHLLILRRDNGDSVCGLDTIIAADLDSSRMLQENEGFVYGQPSPDSNRR